MRRYVFALAMLCISMQAFAVETYLYAQKDTCSLYLDIHRPTAGSQTDYRGISKPTIIHAYGGGFKMGARNEAYLLKRFKTLNDNGYTVVAIDYRLGMKGYKMGKGLIGVAKAVNLFYDSQQMGVEDMQSAIAFLAEHPELGIDINNLVVSGSSAGAIIAMACAYDITNDRASGLPEGFRLQGVISYAGGIISLTGAPKYREIPCPLLLFHGMNDNAVAYKHLSMFGKGVWGSSFLARRLKKQGATYIIYRVKHRAHDVAAYMNDLWPEERAFLERNVMLREHCVMDATIDNPNLPVWEAWGKMTPQELYNGD